MYCASQEVPTIWFLNKRNPHDKRKRKIPFSFTFSRVVLRVGYSRKGSRASQREQWVGQWRKSNLSRSWIICLAAARRWSFISGRHGATPPSTWTKSSPTSPPISPVPTFSGFSLSLCSYIYILIFLLLGFWIGDGYCRWRLRSYQRYRKNILFLLCLSLFSSR